MSVDTSLAVGPACGAAGCRDDALFICRHPQHGQRALCEEHARDFEVIRDV